MRSRYPRIIPSFVDPPATFNPGSSRSASANTDTSKLEVALQELVRSLQPSHLVDTIQKLLEQKRYKLFVTRSKQPHQWRSYNGLTGSWLECSLEVITNVARKGLEDRANAIAHKLDRLEHSIVTGTWADTPALMQLIQQRREWLHSRLKEMSGEAIQKTLTSLAAAPPSLPAVEVFATGGQGCFETSNFGWRRLNDEEACAQMQTTFVTGRVPDKLIPGAPAEALEAETTLLCNLVGQALYRNRHEGSLVIQIVGERADEARRKLLATCGGYLTTITPSDVAFSRRRFHVHSNARLGLLELDGVSHRTSAKALKRLLALKDHPLLVVVVENDLTPLRLPPATRLLYIHAATIAEFIKHNTLLPATLAHESPGEVPTAAEVRKRVLRDLLRGWIEEESITAHQTLTSEPQTVPLARLVQELKRTPEATAFPSLSPSQRELSVELERLGFTVVNHSNTLMVKTSRLS